MDNTYNIDEGLIFDISADNLVCKVSGRKPLGYDNIINKDNGIIESTDGYLSAQKTDDGLWLGAGASMDYETMNLSIGGQTANNLYISETSVWYNNSSSYEVASGYIKIVSDEITYYSGMGSSRDIYINSGQKIFICARMKSTIDGGQLLIQTRDNGANHTTKLETNITANEWYTLKGIHSYSDYRSLYFNLYHLSGDESNIPSTDELFIDTDHGIFVIPLYGDDLLLTEDELYEKYCSNGYWEGIQSAQNPTVKQVGQNLIDPNNFITVGDGSQYGSIAVDDTTIKHTLSTNTYGIKNEVYLKANTTYTLGADIIFDGEYGSSYGFRIMKDGIVISGTSDYFNNKTFTTTDEGIYAIALYEGFPAPSQEGKILEVNNIIMVEGATLPDEYISYTSTTLTTSGVDLRSVPNGVSDTFEYTNGVSTYTKNVGIYEITGDEDWTFRNDNGSYSTFSYVYTDDIPSYNKNDDSYNFSMFINDTELLNLGQVSGYTGAFIDNEHCNLFSDAYNAKAIYITIDNDKLTELTATAFKEYLSTNDVKLYYELETPIVIEEADFAANGITVTGNLRDRFGAYDNNIYTSFDSEINPSIGMDVAPAIQINNSDYDTPAIDNERADGRLIYEGFTDWRNKSFLIEGICDARMSDTFSNKSFIVNNINGSGGGKHLIQLQGIIESKIGLKYFGILVNDNIELGGVNYKILYWEDGTTTTICMTDFNDIGDGVLNLTYLNLKGRLTTFKKCKMWDRILSTDEINELIDDFYDDTPKPYMSFDFTKSLVDSVGGVTPMGYDSLVPRGDSIIESSDGYLCGQRTNDGLWIGKGTENLYDNVFYNDATLEIYNKNISTILTDTSDPHWQHILSTTLEIDEIISVTINIIKSTLTRKDTLQIFTLENDGVWYNKISQVSEDILNSFFETGIKTFNLTPNTGNSIVRVRFDTVDGSCEVGEGFEYTIQIERSSSATPYVKNSRNHGKIFIPNFTDFRNKTFLISGKFANTGDNIKFLIGTKSSQTVGSNHYSSTTPFISDIPFNAVISFDDIGSIYGSLKYENGETVDVNTYNFNITDENLICLTYGIDALGRQKRIDNITKFDIYDECLTTEQCETLLEYGTLEPITETIEDSCVFYIADGEVTDRVNGLTPIGYNTISAKDKGYVDNEDGTCNFQVVEVEEYDTKMGPNIADEFTKGDYGATSTFIETDEDGWDKYSLSGSSDYGGIIGFRDTTIAIAEECSIRVKLSSSLKSKIGNSNLKIGTSGVNIKSGSFNTIVTYSDDGAMLKSSAVWVGDLINRCWTILNKSYTDSFDPETDFIYIKDMTIRQEIQYTKDNKKALWLGCATENIINTVGKMDINTWGTYSGSIATITDYTDYQNVSGTGGTNTLVFYSGAIIAALASDRTITSVLKVRNNGDKTISFKSSYDTDNYINPGETKIIESTDNGNDVGNLQYHLHTKNIGDEFDVDIWWEKSAEELTFSTPYVEKERRNIGNLKYDDFKLNPNNTIAISLYIDKLELYDTSNNFSRHQTIINTHVSYGDNNGGFHLVKYCGTSNYALITKSTVDGVDSRVIVLDSNTDYKGEMLIVFKIYTDKITCDILLDDAVIYSNTAINDMSNLNNAIKIGNMIASNSNEYLIDYIKNISIFNKILSDDEIQELHERDGYLNIESKGEYMPVPYSQPARDDYGTMRDFHVVNSTNYELPIIDGYMALVRLSNGENQIIDLEDMTSSAYVGDGALTFTELENMYSSFDELAKLDSFNAITGTVEFETDVLDNYWRATADESKLPYTVKYIKKYR